MTNLDEARAKSKATYDAAADCFDHPANSFWERFGRRTVERLALSPGARVLDVCCGSGASALPAAEIVGPNGSVVGIDLSQKLLDLGRSKARERRLDNIEFRLGDMLDTRLPDASFDAVVCVFGIFFVPDIAAAAKSLWRHVRRRGKLAVTTWGPGFMEPGTAFFWESVRALRPDLYRGFNPWDRVCEPDALRAVLVEGGVTGIDVVAESGVHEIGSSADWWATVMGTGYRGTVEQLSERDRETVRSANLAYVERGGSTRLDANVVYAVARRG